MSMQLEDRPTAKNPNNEVWLLWISDFLGGIYATEELANNAVDNDENLEYYVESRAVVTG